jgi:hypothetical protein
MSRTRAVPPAAIVACVLAALLAACHDDVVSPRAKNLSFTSLLAPQKIMVGERLQLKALIEVDGVPAEGVPVTWSTRTGSLVPMSASDSNGIAQAAWTLPTSPATTSATATVQYLGFKRWLTFPVEVVPGAPSTILRDVGDGAAVAVNSCHRLFYLKVFVADKYGNAMEQGRVEWTIVEGPVELASYNRSLASNISFFAALPEVGTAHVRASIETGASVDFSLFVIPARYEVAYLENDYGGPSYFESGQNCGGYDTGATDTISVGETMTWKNETSSPMHLLPAEGTAFPETPVIPAGSKHSIVFATPGKYRYMQVDEPSIIGTLIVR